MEGFSKVDAVVSKVVEKVSKISPIFLIIIALAATINVIIAKTTGSSIPSVNDWIRHFMIPCVWLSVGNVAVNRGLIRVDFIAKHYSDVLNRIVLAFSYLLGTGVTAFICIQQFGLLKDNYEGKTISSISAFHFHLWPFNLLLVIGLAITSLSLLWCVIRQFVPKKKEEVAKA